MNDDGRKTILLVEDEAIIALRVKATLEKRGFTVLIAPSGEKAVETARSTPALDLVLMDINLGRGMDGTEAARLILAERDLPLVFHSSHTEPDVVEKTEGITSYGYIVKNSGDTVLLASIKMAFRLHASEEKFRTSFENVATGMVLTSPDGRLFRVNQAFCSMLGYDAEEILSLEFADLTYPEDRAPSIDHMRSLLRGEADRCRFSKRYTHKDGRIVRTDISVVLLRDASGAPLHFVTHVQDVTERLRMEEELNRSLERYDLLLKSAPVSILVVQDGKYAYCNPYGARLMGYASPDEVVGIPVMATIAEEYREMVRTRIGKAAAGLENVPAEMMLIRKDGSRILSESVSIPIVFNGKQGAIVLGRDISEQKKAERRLASIIKAVPAGIGVVMGTERVITEVNDTLCAMLGYASEELVGKCASVFYDSLEEFEAVGRAKYRQITELGTGTVETRWKRKDGSIIDVYLSSTPIYPSDRSQGVTFSASDITERKRTEAKLAAILGSS